jgi:hypothetical protein
MPPFDEPVQLADDDANPSAGHAPDDPVQLSGTSHWPVEARHTVVLARKTSTHELFVPLQ